jgi:hypothetical protein
MTAVHIQTASKLYTVTGVGYAPAGMIKAPAAAAVTTTAAAQPPPPSQAGIDTDPTAAAATASMAAPGPGLVVQVELGDAELAALKELLEGAVLCNDSALNVVQDEATGEAGCGLAGVGSEKTY